MFPSSEPILQDSPVPVKAAVKRSKRARRPYAPIDREGRVLHRTRLMPEERAVRFARCLNANGRFHDAEAVRSRRARTEDAWYVHYLPASPDRCSILRDRMQRVRKIRAEIHGPAYQYWQDPDTPSLVWCLSDSGEVYELTLDLRAWRFIDCNCMDYCTRCRRARLDDKHMIEGNDRLAGNGRPIEWALGFHVPTGGRV